MKVIEMEIHSLPSGTVLRVDSLSWLDHRIDDRSLLEGQTYRMHHNREDHPVLTMISDKDNEYHGLPLIFVYSNGFQATIIANNLN